ncbi:MAG TPA: LapA family protein [Nonomuraea sp.]|nr:LapA family protein [Nonomuraea sp.]
MIVGHSKSDVDAKSARQAGRRDIVHIVVALALVAAIAALALDNRQEVTVSWLFGDATMPLYQLFVGTFAVGVVVGFLLRMRRHHNSH